MLDRDLIAEESRRACAGVGDQGLLGGQFQLEFITQELRQPLFDLLGLGLRPGEPEEVVVGVPAVAQPPVTGIVADPGWAGCAAAGVVPAPGPVTALAGSRDRVRRPARRPGSGPARSPGCIPG